MSEKKKLLVAGIVFVVTFLVFRAIFSNWYAIKSFLF
jgi:hypothetical protein